MRRKKQFAMIGPGTNTRVDVGINLKDLTSDPRLLEQPKGSMCNYIVRLNDLAQVDAVLLGWLRSRLKCGVILLQKFWVIAKTDQDIVVPFPAGAFQGTGHK